MKPGVPWSVKGIEPQARETAKEAARRAGMTVGEWLNQMIFTAGEPDQSIPIEDRIAAAAGQGAAAPAYGYGGGNVTRMHGAAYEQPPSADRDAALYSALESLGRRLEKAEHTSTIALSAIDRSIETALSRLETLEDAKKLQGREHSDALGALQSARDALEARMEQLERNDPSERRTAALKGLESLVAQVALNIDRRQKQTTERVERIEKATSDDRERLNIIEKTAADDRGRLDLIERSMSDDRERIDAVEEAISADRDHVEAVE
ncbi:MAG: hypothetical protein AAGL49_09270, partial [Pseudomonadota bacterium]